MKQRFESVVASLLFFTLTTAFAIPMMAVESWSVDAAHSEVSFAVNHFFTPVRGTFGEFDVRLTYDPKRPSESRVSAKVPVASIATKNHKRDEHLRSADWFEADKHPHLTFESTSVRPDGRNRLIATGNLTMKGITRKINLPIEILGIKDIPKEMQGMIGAKQVASFRATVSLDRNDYEVGVGSWAATAVVGDTVDIEILLEAHRK